MRAITRASALLAALLMMQGCGSTGDSGGGARHLPVSGSGPFTPLEPDPSLEAINPPFVLADNNADRDGDGYTNLEEYLNALAEGALTTGPAR